VVHLRGELDFATLPPIHQTLVSVAGRAARAVVLDLEGVTFLESTAVGTFVGMHRRLREQGKRFALTNVMGRVARTLQIAALHKMMPVVVVDEPERPWEQEPSADDLLAALGIYG
jgi:anti-sigma B factor antagonist